MKSGCGIVGYFSFHTEIPKCFFPVPKRMSALEFLFYNWDD